jgi:hypothetical protein
MKTSWHEIPGEHHVLGLKKERTGRVGEGPGEAISPSRPDVRGALGSAIGAVPPTVVAGIRTIGGCPDPFGSLSATKEMIAQSVPNWNEKPESGHSLVNQRKIRPCGNAKSTTVGFLWSVLSEKLKYFPIPTRKLAMQET